MNSFLINILSFSGCQSSIMSNFIAIAKGIIYLICIIVPILLIISLTIKLVQLVNNPDEKKMPKNILNSILATVIIFFIPLIINVIINISSSNATDTEKFNFQVCWKNAKMTGFSSSSKYFSLTEEDHKKNIFYNADEYEKGTSNNNNSNNSSNKNNSSNNESNNTEKDSSVETNYGVFLGLDHDSGLSKLYNYKLVVIDLQEFTKNDIEKLHNKGIKVYSYLNVGSVENYRSYYKKFKSFYLGTYENWEDEKWIDVSQKSYQDFLINELEPSLRQKGADGYFIDNCDVYANFKKEKIYKGLQTILGAIHSHNLPMLINGGDVFVTKAINDGSYRTLFDGVNQEEVFTVINFDNHTYHNQDSDDTNYYKQYLSKVKSKKLKVYLLEYGASKNKENEIKKYCEENNFSYYNANSYNLT